MNLKPLFLILFIGFSNFSFSQSQFLDGFIVDNKMDTLKGSIYFEDWIVSPKVIRFKDVKNEEFEVRAGDIKSFQFTTTNTIYESKKATIKYVNTKPISSLSNLFVETDSSFFFFKLLLKSNVLSLYSLSDAIQAERFFVQKGNDFSELVKYDFIKQTEDDKTFLYKNEDYLNQIRNLCSDAPSLKISPPMYNEAALKKYFAKYNACFETNVSVNYTSIKPKPIFRVGVLYGIENFKYLSNSIPLSNHSYGLSAMMNLPKKNHNRFIKFQATSSPNTFNNFEKEYNSDQDFKNSNFELGLTYGELFGNGAIQPYLSGSFQARIEKSNRSSLGNYQVLQFFSINGGVAYKKIVYLEASRLLTFLGKKNGIGPQISLTIYPLSFNK